MLGQRLPVFPSEGCGAEEGSEGFCARGVVVGGDFLNAEVAKVTQRTRRGERVEEMRVPCSCEVCAGLDG